MTCSNKLYDVIGVGFGPSNIALAIYFEEFYPQLSSYFYEKKETISWQDQLQIDGADIQNHPLRDLATSTNPRSKYTFVNYLFEKGRLFEHFNLNYHFPLRSEYQDYIKWVSSHFENNMSTSIEVNNVSIENDLLRIELSTGKVNYSPNLVLAVGRPANIPDVFLDICKKTPQRVVHSSMYNNFLEEHYSDLTGLDLPKVAVIGGGQSAVEISLDLYRKFPNLDLSLITRSFSPKLKDTSEFTYEWVFPQFVDVYYNANTDRKLELQREIRRSNYNSVDSDVLSELYRVMYVEKYLKNKARVRHIRSNDIISVEEDGNRITLKLYDKLQECVRDIGFDYVILATGFRDLGVSEEYKFPKVLDGLKTRLKYVGNALDISRDYCLNLEGTRAKIYLHGMSEVSHGFGDSGSFSSVAFRSKVIADSITRLSK